MQILTAPLIHLGTMSMSAGDLAGFATGLASVAFAARGSILNFPFAMINSIILGAVFFHARLYGVMSLQVVFFVLGVQGWIQWMLASSKDDAKPKPIQKRDFVVGLAMVCGLTLILREVLMRLGGAASWPDAFITSASMWAQWLLNRKSISTWAWWIGVDIVSIPLYWSRQLPLIAFLYVLFLGLCIQGWYRWRVAVR
ncbi:MAG: nicotinamide riboside transporter PnuC [Fibrobacteria bacterium]